MDTKFSLVVDVDVFVDVLFVDVLFVAFKMSSSFKEAPTICLTCPAWISIQPLKRVMVVKSEF